MEQNNNFPNGQPIQLNAAPQTQSPANHILRNIHWQNIVCFVCNVLTFLCICCLYDLGMWISCLSLLLAAILFKNALTIRFFYKIPFRLSYVVAIINILLAMIMIILCGNYYGLLLAPVCFPLVLMAVVSKKRQLQLSTLKTCMPQDEYTRIMSIEEQKKLSTTMVILLVAGFTNDVLISYCFFQGLPAIITPLYVGATAAAFTVLFFFLTVSSAVGIVFAGYAISTLKKMRKQQILKPKGLRILGYSSIVANFIPLLLFVILVGIFVIV